MEATRRPRTVDPDFDRSTLPPIRLRDFDALEHQRLVVNPFLAAFVLVLFWQVAGWLMVLGLLLLPQLIQYHCLDCGQTGRYFRRNRHACPAVYDRWQDGRREWFRFPSSWAQMVVWSWLLGAVALLLAIIMWIE